MLSTQKVTDFTHDAPIRPRPAAAMPASRSGLRLVEIGSGEHLAFVEARGASFLQCPSWARVKTGWSAHRLGWRDNSGRLRGVAQVLTRDVPVPAVRRRFCYLPEGPVIDWTDPDLAAWLNPLVDRLRHDLGAFAVRLGPPVELRRWQADTVRAASRAGAGRLRYVGPDEADPVGQAVGDTLASLGWRHVDDAAQPRFCFRLPLAGRELEAVWDGLSPQWRRNIGHAHRNRVRTGEGGPEDLSGFFDLLGQTQRRNGFDLGRDLDYYQRQYRELRAEAPERIRLMTAHHDGDLLAAHSLIRVGDRAVYQTGASADHNCRLRPSNALQWQMIKQVYAEHAAEYDMRGVKDCLDPDCADWGLLRFKLGTGGHVAENLGEFDFVLNRPLYRAFRRCRDRRG